ncbi:MAG: hypothetical protein ACRD92_05325 [Nitrosopumilaceae archaeon]
MFAVAINVQALCVPSDDWPGMPCVGPQGKPNLEKWKQAWNEYYQYKGKDWMEMKKSEMDKVITEGNLKEWTGLGETNYNVWYYYWINDQAPNPFGVSLDEAFDTSSTHELLFEQIVAASISTAAIVAIVLVARRRTRKTTKI